MRARTPHARIAARTVGLIVAAAMVVEGGSSLATHMAHDQRSLQRALPAQLTRLDVDLPGHVTIQGNAGATPVAIQTVHTGLTAPRVDFEATSGSVRYIADCRWFDDRCSVDARLIVNPDVPVTVRSSSGGVTLRALRGPAELVSDSGNIAVSDTTGDLALRTDFGNIRAVEVGAGRLVGRSDSGNVSVTMAVAPQQVTLRTDSGNVELVLPEGPETYRIDATTDSGATEVLVRTDPTSTRVITLRSDSGNVSVRYARP